jgi:leucyl/phenylalanyl-tRNA--protein transferase
VRSPTVLDPDDFTFPHPDTALTEPNGLLAVGGDLSPGRLLNAYSHGIFPWFDQDRGPILWWSPDPRAVVSPTSLKVSRSLRRVVARGKFEITADLAFEAVVSGCAAPRSGASGTWITPAIQDAYRRLHQLGFAHSVESWWEGALVGGLYGVALGKMFFGESMFTQRSDASKVAFVALANYLAAKSFVLIDCQMMNPHLRSLGVVEMPRRAFLAALDDNRRCPTEPGKWRMHAR